MGFETSFPRRLHEDFPTGEEAQANKAKTLEQTMIEELKKANESGDQGRARRVTMQLARLRRQLAGEDEAA